MLKRITSNDPVQRLYVGLHESTLDLLQAYRDNYQHVYGDELPQNLAIETMLQEFMAADKDFQKYLKTRQTPPKKERRSSADSNHGPESGEAPLDPRQSFGMI